MSLDIKIDFDEGKRYMGSFTRGGEIDIYTSPKLKE